MTFGSPALAPASGPLRGTRVLEVCEGIAGPLAGWLLAELGCDVVKVEPASGDRLRGTPAFHVLARSKRSVRASGGPGAAERLRDLCAAADVILVDRGIERRLGDERARRALEEALSEGEGAAGRRIVCRVSPFGEQGPLADLPDDDALVCAASGISAMQWSSAGGPIYLTTPLTAYACGMTAALGVAAALRARLETGAGQEVRASQLGAGLLFQSGTYVAGPGSGGSLLGQVNDPHGALPTYGFYRASDDWLFVGALTETFWARLCLTIERPDLLERPDLEGTPMAFVAPPERRAFVRRTLEEAFARKTREEWLALLRANDVPAGPILDRTTFLRDEATRFCGMHAELDDPELGRTEQPGLALRFTRTPGAIRGPAPRLGAHDAEVARDWSAARDAAPPPPGGARPLAAPLDGVRVVSFATFIAGALCPMLLADLGAEVIKVEPPGGDPFRAGTRFGFLGWNRGTRSLAIDLRSNEGRDLVLRLIERADLVVDNFRVGVLERLGLDFASLERRNPRLVQLSITGYGVDGPYAELPCFDPIMQARSGLARAQSGFDPTMYAVAYTDYATATLAALAAVAALVARDGSDGAPGGERRGQRVWTSMLGCACVMQAGFLIEHPGRVPDPPGAPDLRGTSAWRRAYPAADGWVLVAARDEAQRRALLATLGIPASAGDAHDAARASDADNAPVDGALARRIAAATAARTVAELLVALRAASVPAVACPVFPGLVDDEQTRANGYWWRDAHPELGEVVQTGAVLGFSRTPMRLGPTAPLLGEHSVEILREAGADEATIARLVASGVVVQADVANARGARS